VTELTDLTLEECAQGLRKGDFTSLDLTRAFLERIERLDPDVGAFLWLDPERAQAQAAARDGACRPF
jgi:aspartyl-tRNA(Asn)/glutamyl-tRNA(Gln) amidotransferase subunit A